MVDNMSTNHTFNSTTDGLISPGLLTGLCIFSAFTALVNIVILLASKYTTAGKSAILVFMRSLCVADLLIGMFGVFKTLILMHIHHSWINCFLPDSIFVSASTMICFTLLWLNIDSYLRLTRPFGYGNSMDKQSVIIAMMLMWNGGFILGFLPQLGWNVDEYSCNYFTFYSIIYTSIMSLIWIICIIGSLVFEIYICKLLGRIKLDCEFMTSNSLQYALYSQLVKTIRIDITLLVFCYVPFLIYICIYFIKATFEDTRTASKDLIYFLPVFLFRSFICAFIHSYQTIRLQSLTPNRTGSILKLFKRSAQLKNSDQQLAVFCSSASNMNIDTGNTEFLQQNPLRHSKLQQNLSNTTITTVVESHCTCSARNSNASTTSSSTTTKGQDSSSSSSSINSIHVVLQPTDIDNLTTYL